MGRPYESIHIYHITDTFDDRARGKIDGAYSLHRGRIGLRNAGYTLTPGINSIDVGIAASEFISNTQRPDRLIIAVNYAPPDPEKKRTGTDNNHRKDFFCAELADNVVVCGTSNGHEFTYVKDRIRSMFRLTNTNSLNSQFRSLEILPEHTLRFSDPLIRKQLIATGILAPVSDIDSIVPDAPAQSYAIEIDNFQNVKLFPSLRDLRMLRDTRAVRFSFGKASIEAGKRQRQPSEGWEGIVAPTLFKAPEGTNVLALKSSSRLLGFEEIDSNVPIIATMRQRPAETRPQYTAPIVGAKVWLTPQIAG